MSEKALPMPQPNPVPTADNIPPVAVETERARAIRFQNILAQANRVRILPSGKRMFVRFNQLEIMEHWVLLVSFLTLAFTGVLDILAHNRIFAEIITVVFRDIDKLRGFHNLVAILFTVLILWHAARTLTRWFVKNENPRMLWGGSDMRAAGQTWKYLLGRKNPRPESGRFDVGQKFTYWLTAVFALLMLLTSAVMWLNAALAPLLPDAVLPIVRAIHDMTGLLALFSLLPLHLYHTVLKEWNPSIFTGVMDEETIRRKHPGEYRQIIAAIEEYQRLLDASQQRKH
jgi:formate dehydrogenase gamma subunit